MNPAPTIEILLEGKPHRVLAGTTLAALIASLGHAENAVTAAVNGSFVARHARADRVLEHGDAVLLFQPIVGG